ncbi:hypothetical protein GGF50DRAFT_118439 [Schizophyllum commune]
MCAKGISPTEDSLEIDGPLLDASRLAQLVARGDAAAEPTLLTVVSVANASLGLYDKDELSYPAHARLAFRELGIVTALRAVWQIGRQLDGNGQTRLRNRERLLRALEKLESYEDLADRIEKSWMKEENRMAKSWAGHEDINAVMLVTTLAPDAFLEPPIVRVSQAQAGIACGLELVAHKEVLDAIDGECLR